MLGISASLGNAKPQVLRDVETEIWKTLCSLASGMNDPFDLLHKLAESLPWDRIQAASCTDSTWFNLGEYLFKEGLLL